MTSLRTTLIRLVTTASVAAVASLGLMAPAHAVPDPVCGDTLTASVVLTGDLNCDGSSGSAALTAGADWITINLNGFSIVNTGGFYSVIDIQSHTGVTVRNGTIGGVVANFQPTAPGASLIGVYVVGSSRVTLENLVITDTGVGGLGAKAVNGGGIAGVWVSDSSKVRLTNVESVRSDGNGASISGSTDVSVSKSSFSKNFYAGMFIEGSSKVQINQSRFDANGADGLVIDGSNSVQVNRSSMSHNGFKRLDGASAPRGANGIDGGSGVAVNNSDAIRIYRGVANANYGNGVSASPSLEAGVATSSPSFQPPVTSVQIDKSNLSYNGGNGFYSKYMGFRITETTLVDNSGNGLYSTGSPTFVIRKVRATLNDLSGIAVDDNTAGAQAYLIEYTVSNTNDGDGFDVANPVTARKNSAAGNGSSNVLP